MPLPIATIQDLARDCAPAVSPATLVAVVEAESGRDPLAIRINGPRPARLHFDSEAAAIQTAARLWGQGSNIDLGLAQINTRNLAVLGLSVATAFDPCRNLAGAAKILADDYARSNPQPGAEQAALRASLSLYNTGDPVRGFRNGYVSKVAAAARMVPALQPDPSIVAAQARPAAPVWDVFAQSPQPTAGFVFTPALVGDRP